MEQVLNRSQIKRWLIGLSACTVAAIISATLLHVSAAQSQSAASRSVAQLQGPVSFADVVAAVSPAVVNIAVEKRSQSVALRAPGFNGRGAPSPFDDFFGRFFEAPGGPGAPQAPAEPRAKALGSGFIVDASGYVVTNNHVIADADNVVVVLENGDELAATVVGLDTKTDLALLKVDAGRDLPFVQFGDSDQTRVGEWVLAIGNPFGLGGSVTAGIISARGRDIQSGPYDNYLQIDAPINSGNSGGPVFNGAGQVIGVNTAIYSPNGGNIGIGFAIPARQAQSVVAALRESGTVTRGWLGVQIQGLDDDLAEVLGVSDGRGALVSELVADSPAARSGLQSGDLIREVDGESIEDPRHLSRVVAAANPGQKIELEVLRNGRMRSIDVMLGNLDGDTTVVSGIPANSGSSSGSAQLAGMRVSELNDVERQQLGLPDDVRGVLVTGVEPGSAAAEKGIRRGDVITEINYRTVENVGAASAALQAARNNAASALLVLRRGDSQRYVALALT